MHEELYHSPERPFRATPDIRYYFAHDSVEAARQTVVRAVLRAEGPVMVLGGAGLGKSLLGTVVVKDFAARFDIVQLHAARLCSRRALLQSILFELDLPYRDLSEGELRLSILARLEPSSDHAPDGVVIVVDEAHTLPAKLLDELRLISNFTRANQPRARLVLIGNLRLEDIFAEPQLESFNQRLAARCYLQPMNRQQTRQYVFHQLTTAGFNPKELITEDATQAVYAASDGVPRLVNQIMDHALALAATGNQCPISSSLVEEAWADLQQLPAPWHAGADKSPSQLSTSPNAASTVEFGVLDGDDDWGTASEMVVEPPQQPSTTTPTNASRPAPNNRCQFDHRIAQKLATATAMTPMMNCV
ncbi:MAG: AAA family ATPase [Pirellulaceae bacterium]